jgi:hypothetical protein
MAYAQEATRRAQEADDKEQALPANDSSEERSTTDYTAK